LDGADLCPSCYRGAIDASELQAERREVWRDAFSAAIGLIPSAMVQNYHHAALCADDALKEFDKRFAPKTDDY